MGRRKGLEEGRDGEEEGMGEEEIERKGLGGNAETGDV